MSSNVIIHPVTLVVSPGRSGTKYLYEIFSRTFGGEIFHELLRGTDTYPAFWHRCYKTTCIKEVLNHSPVRNLVRKWKKLIKTTPVIDFGWTMSCLVPPFYHEFGQLLRVILLHRHPVSATASHCIMGNYSDYQYKGWAITPRHPNARYSNYSDIWDSLSAFEKGLFRWLEITSYGFELKDKYPELNVMEVSSDDLFREPGTIKAIALFAGFSDASDFETTREFNPTMKWNLERRPIGSEWLNYNRFAELNELAEFLGYDMSLKTVKKIIMKYQLPKGIIPYLRYKTGYWKYRAFIGQKLRNFGLLK